MLLGIFGFVDGRIPTRDPTIYLSFFELVVSTNNINRRRIERERKRRVWVLKNRKIKN